MRNSNPSYRLIGAIMLFILPLAAFSQQGGKIGVVDMERLFKGYHKTAINSAKFNKQAEVFKEYADKLAASQLKLEEEFRVLRDASQNIALSEAERENKRLAARDKYRQLEAKQAELQQYDKEKSEQLKEEYEKMRKELLSDIRKSIARYAKQEGYVIVLDSSGNTVNDIPIISYYQPEMDITDQILEIINVGAKTQ